MVGLGTPNPNHPRAGSCRISHYSAGFTQFRVSRNPWSQSFGVGGLLSAGGCSCLIAQPRVEPPGGGPVSNAILVFVVRIVWPTGCFRVVVALVLTASLVVPAGSVAAQGGFSDLDEAGSHRAGVEELAETGVLAGTLCAPGEFCPGEPLARWVMAVWLVRVLDSTDPVGSDTRFADVGSDEWWAPYVERLAVLGVTTGCATGPARYCPHDSVTRAQMATFLTRAFDLGAASSFGFVDTEGNTHAASIDALAVAGVTAGCATGPARYCPADSVTRAQMATFLTRAVSTGPLSVILASEEPRTVTGPFQAMISFSRSVTSFGLGDIRVVNGRASGLAGSGSGYEITVIPAAEGTVVVRIPEGVARDASGTANQESGLLVRTLRSDGSRGGTGFDTWVRDAVVAAYRAEFEREPPDHGFTGNVADCEAGTTSQPFRDSIVQRANWYRQMAGLNTVTEDPSRSATAQRKALLDSLAAAHTDGQDVVVMAHARQRVDTLNDAMQAPLIGDRDPADEMVIRWDDNDDGGGGERTVGVGERIRTGRNDYDLVTTKGMTVVNGATWQVARIDRGGLWVRSADRGSVYLPASYLEARDEDTGRPHVELGYASTVHSAQGRTVDQAPTVVRARTEAELLYVGMTRGRTSNIAVSGSSDEDGHTRFLTAPANPSAETVAALELIAQEREKDRAGSPGRTGTGRRPPAGRSPGRHEPRRRPSRAGPAVGRQPMAAGSGGCPAGTAETGTGSQGTGGAGSRRGRRSGWTTSRTGQTPRRSAMQQPSGGRPSTPRTWPTPTSRSSRSRQSAGLRRWRAATTPQDLVDAATQRWLVADPEQVADSYTDAYRRRVGNANRWLAEHGRAADDDLDRETEIAQRFRLLTGTAETVVEHFDTHQRKKIGEWIENNLQAGTTWVTAIWVVDREWAGTRYRADAHLAAEKWWNDERERHRQERETQERGRGGIDL